MNGTARPLYDALMAARPFVYDCCYLPGGAEDRRARAAVVLDQVDGAIADAQNELHPTTENTEATP